MNELEFEATDLEETSNKVKGKGIIQNASDMMRTVANNNVKEAVKQIAQEYRKDRQAIKEDKVRREKQAKEEMEKPPVPTGNEIEEEFRKDTYREMVDRDER